MSELSLWGNPENLPLVTLPGECTNPTQYDRLQENAAFFMNAYPEWVLKDRQQRPLLHAATRAMAAVLDTVDTQFGRHAHDSPGPQYLQDPWGSFPTFYHGGDGTRLAILGCVDYMAYVNSVEGPRSPYYDVETYLATLTTAACDDIVVGNGRGKDEARSAQVAAHTLQRWPFNFSPSFIEGVRTGVEESLFDEKIWSQGTGALHAKFRPIMLGSQASDLWILFLEARPQYAMRLGIENLYKADTAAFYGQILLHKAREKNFIGQNIFDFLDFMGKDDELRQEYGRFVYESADFGDVHAGSFQFSDERLNNEPILRQARRENSTILRTLGENILLGATQGGMTPLEAYRHTAGRLYSTFGSGSASHAQTPVYKRRDRLYPAHTRTSHER